MAVHQIGLTLVCFLSLFPYPSTIPQAYTDTVLMLCMTGVVRAEPHSSLTAFTHSSQRMNICW